MKLCSMIIIKDIFIINIKLQYKKNHFNVMKFIEIYKNEKIIHNKAFIFSLTLLSNEQKMLILIRK